jgi:hypothetical protein
MLSEGPIKLSNGPLSTLAGSQMTLSGYEMAEVPCSQVVGSSESLLRVL